MKNVNVRLSFCLVVLAVLVLPISAGAHPSLFNVTGKVARSPEIQTITIDATGGTFKPSAGSSAVAWNAPAYAVQAALGADPAIGRSAIGQSNVMVTGNDGGPYTLRFQGGLAAANQNQVVPDGSLLTGGAGTAIAATSIEGGQADITYTGDPSGASLPNDVNRTTITNDGFVASFVESNGLATGGWLNLRFMPGAYRTSMTEPQWLTWPMAQTGIQSHATCQNVPTLNTEANILAVQNNATDPFWNYVPWQKTSAGLGDEPEQWLDVVETATGVDLATLTTVAEFRAACEGEGGVYVPADNPSNPASGQVAAAVAAAVAPLNAMIADLQQQLADSEAARQALINRPVKVILQARRQSGKVVAMVSGPLNQSVRVTLRLRKALADRLGLPQVVDGVQKPFGSTGAVIVTLIPGRAALNALHNRGFVSVSVWAVLGSDEKATTGEARF
jgi:hypothetical protein